MSDLETDDPAWNLLGHAKKVEPSPFFARNVVREARLLSGGHPGWWSRLTSLVAGPRALYATAACAVLAVALVVLVPRVGDDTGPGLVISAGENATEAFDPAAEIADVEYLGRLMAVADPGQLDDAALADLFF